MFQHIRLNELTPSLKLLLTAFILLIFVSGFLGIAACYHSCEGLDGRRGVSFSDVIIYVRGSELSVLDVASDNPLRYSIDATRDDLAKLRQWASGGAPQADSFEIQRILKGSVLETDKYSRLKMLATPVEPLSPATMASGMAMYLAVAGAIFLGLGLMFVRTSLFERTKLFFIAITFSSAVIFPLSFMLIRRNEEFVYPMLLAGLALIVCLGVFAWLSLFDIWFRKSAN